MTPFDAEPVCVDDATAPRTEANSPLLHAALPALDELFKQHARFVAWVAVRTLGRNDEIDDVVQEVFLNAMRDLKSVRDPTAVRAWLKTVTVRQARRRLYKRKLKRFFHLDSDEHEVADIAASDAGPEERATLRQVYRMLDRLPVEERLAWTLRYVDGETLPSVAILVGCSLATAKRRIAAAQRRIDQGVA